MNDDSRKPNGDYESTPNSRSANIPPHPLNDVVSTVQGGSVLEMQTGLFNLGRNRALHSGTTEPRSEDILTLTDHARAMARQTYRDKYDPSQNVHDAMHETEYRRDLAQREEAEKAEQYAAANLRDTEINLARTPKAGPKPGAHPLLVAAFVVAIMLSVAPTLHDSIFLTIGDGLLNWFGSCLSAAFVGVMLTLAILSGRFNKNHLESTKFYRFQQGLASGSGPGGRWFKSTRPDHLFSTIYAVERGPKLNPLVSAQVTEHENMRKMRSSSG